MTGYTCPACGAAAAAGTTRCGCGADLALLAGLAGVADAWFNRGQEALAAGDPARAVEWLAACSAARPTDAAALRALARAWGRLGQPAAALAALDRAAAVDPDTPALAGLRRALAADRADHPPPSRGGRPETDA